MGFFEENSRTELTAIEKNMNRTATKRDENYEIGEAKKTPTTQTPPLVS
jgi:hypothetical protein